MKKLNLKNYTYQARSPQGINQLLDYHFKDVLMNILTHPSLSLNGAERMDIEPLVNKIEKADSEIILTEDDFNKIINACKKFRGFAKNDGLFLKRIYGCVKISDDGNKVVELNKFRSK